MEKSILEHSGAHETVKSNISAQFCNILQHLRHIQSQFCNTLQHSGNIAMQFCNTLQHFITSRCIATPYNTLTQGIWQQHRASDNSTGPSKWYHAIIPGAFRSPFRKPSGKDQRRNINNCTTFKTFPQVQSASFFGKRPRGPIIPETFRNPFRDIPETPPNPGQNFGAPFHSGELSLILANLDTTND